MFKIVYLNLIFVFASFLCSEVFAVTITPDIKANGVGGSVEIPKENPVTVTVAVSLDSDYIGVNADWWVAADTPFGWHYFSASTMSWFYAGGSYTDLSPTHQGPLFDLSPFEVLNALGLPEGVYTLYFAVDTNMNGLLDIESMFYDRVSVVISDPNKFLFPDTGQTQDFTPTFGEDSDYTINPPTYTDNSDGTVTDENTKLMWQKEDDDIKRGQEDSVIYCEDLLLDGYTDWRVPDLQELYSIVNLGKSIPVIDEEFFPNTNFSFWSSSVASEFAYGKGYAWFADFFGGNISAENTGNYHYVRCVRGKQNTTDITDNGDGTVTNSVTGLMWLKETDDSMLLDWIGAIEYSEKLFFAGYNDWRLPSIKELLSIIDIESDGRNYWSSTTVSDLPSWAFIVNAGIRGDDKSILFNVKCVRTLK
jgi:hypothetical protein